MSKSRLIVAYLFVILTFITLLLRYGYLQLIDHGTLLQLSINNYSSNVASLPTRGAILDKNGVILADNRASYVVALLPKDLKDSTDVLFQRLAKYINYTEIDKKKFEAQKRNSKNYDWIIVKDDLSNTEIANLTAHKYEFPELSVFARTKRFYPFDDIYAHSLGYVGRVSQNDQTKISQAGKVQDYLKNDYIGKNGLEQYYENMLRGKLGKRIIKTDANGNEVGLISNTQATDGYSLQLTIDNNLQKVAWDALGDNKGAIVAIDPETGGILAFVSKPGFNPNWFIDGISVDDWEDLSTDPKKPLLNRASQGTFPPGSTFKPFMAIAALYLGIRTPSSTINDPGYFVIPGSTHRFRDSFKYGRGTINFTKAIAISSDTFFYKLGLDMGIDRADKVLTMFGFGKKTGIDLPHENSGLLPSKEWKKNHYPKDPYQQKWLPGDSVSFGIGQGLNNYTPLQLAYAVSIMANSGKVMKPHFLDKVVDKSGRVIESYSITSTQLPIPQDQFTFVKNAMQKVVTEGTARSISYGLKYTMGGKTGTAQVVSMNQSDRKAKFSGQAYKDHAWFIAFAPVDHPKIAIAIIVENGGWGASMAAPIARKMTDFYLLGPANPAVENTQYKKFTPSKTDNDAVATTGDDEEDDADDDSTTE